jgi:transcriptional regulator with XRE-family HTH domain
MKNAADGQIDQLVKARWLAIGLSQTDLAEVLDAAFKQAQRDSNGSNDGSTARLMQVAAALDIPLDFFRSPAVKTRPGEPEPSCPGTFGSLHALLELRLLRAFQELRDHRTKRMLVHLAEQIVKRQANGRGNAS